MRTRPAKPEICDVTHPKRKLFFASLVIFLIGVLPLLIVTGGKYISVSDFNVQTGLFSEYANRILHEQHGFPTYDLGSSLGLDFLTAYGDFILGPLSWPLLLVPQGAVWYVHTFVIAVKLAVGAVGAYLYCAQYLRKTSSAMICGILYAFSGVQIFYLSFQFTDRVSLFPLLLFTFDRMVFREKRGEFALMLAVCAFTSGYFVYMECVFIAVYYFVLLFTRSCPRLNLRTFLRYAFECLAGVALTAVVLLPQFFSVTNNTRAAELIFDKDFLVYDEPGILVKLVESMFLPPEVAGTAWFYPIYSLCFSQPALYIPFFSVVGVAVAFRREDKRSRFRVLLTVCAVMAVVPLFNSAFSMFNGNYYARWSFMPLLIMILLTGRFLDDLDSYDLKKPLLITACVTGFFALYGVFCVFIQKRMKEQVSEMLIMSSCFALICLGLLYLVRYPRPEFRRISQKNLYSMVCISCTALLLIRSLGLLEAGAWTTVGFLKEMIWNDGVSVDLDQSVFSRTANDSNSDYSSMNIPIRWGYPVMDIFNSTVSAEEAAFYTAIGSERLQSILYNTDDDYPLWTFLSVRYQIYYINRPIGIDELPEKDIYYNHETFDTTRIFNHYITYENSAFIPMGFTFDKYLLLDEGGHFEDADRTFLHPDHVELDGFSLTERQKLLLKAIWLTPEQIDRYGELLAPLSEEEMHDFSQETYFADCDARRASACDSFEPDGHGFTAHIDLPAKNLVFFSVPWSEGFTAYVDGQEVPIEKVFCGLCAVPAEAGSHTIRFDYETHGLHTGAVISCVTAGAFVIYLAAGFVMKKRTSGKEQRVETE